MTDFQYMPVLRWKRAERIALREIPAAMRTPILPLIELVGNRLALHQPGAERASELNSQLSALAQTWSGRPVLLDVGQLGPGFHFVAGDDPLVDALDTSRAVSLPAVPVIRGAGTSVPLNRAAELSVRSGQGVALRLTGTRITRGLLTTLETLVRQHGLDPSNVDLIFDFAIVVPDDSRYDLLGHELPANWPWRSLWVLGGSFPLDLTGFDVGQHAIPRSEWIGWEQVAAVRNETGRPLPGFGDYTIQHPYVAELPDFVNVSASIRYAAERTWVIMRGEGLRNPGGPGYAQYRANAQLLCERPEFRGADFCYGDEYIAATAAAPRITGSPESLLRAGINHHICLTCRQVASFPSPVAPGRPHI